MKYVTVDFSLEFPSFSKYLASYPDRKNATRKTLPVINAESLIGTIYHLESFDL